LIEKTETEEAPREETGEETGQAFTFAQVWTAENEVLEELEDHAPEHTETTDTWARALELIAKEQVQSKAAERTGRGVRRKAAIAAQHQKVDFFDTPTKDKPQRRKRKKSRSTVSEESDAYVNINQSQSENSSDEPVGDDVRQDVAELDVPPMEGPEMPPRLSNKHIERPSTLNPVIQPTPTYSRHNKRDVSDHSPETAVCAMCGNIHQDTCDMTERSENLVHYRQILFTDQTGEPFAERRDAIAIIDGTLKKRGQLHLIYNQPLGLIEKGRGSASGSAKSAKSKIQKPRPTQSSSYRKVPPDPQVRHVEVPYDNVPSSSTSARGRPTETPPPPPPKRSSDTPSSAKKRQKMNSYPGCPVCGGPHHLVKDCPVTAQGSKSIRTAISRLESQSGQTATIAALRGVLDRLEKRAAT